MALIEGPVHPEIGDALGSGGVEDASSRTTAAGDGIIDAIGEGLDEGDPSGLAGGD